MRTAFALYAGKGPPNAAPFVTYMSMKHALAAVEMSSRPRKFVDMPVK